MRQLLVAVVVLGIVCAVTPAQAQEARPGNDLKKLDEFVGEWTFEERAKNQDTGEERVVKGTGEYSKLGDLFRVWQGNTEAGTLLAVDAFNPVTGEIVRHAFTSGGWQGSGTMTFDDDIVTLDTTGVTADGKKTRSRCKGPLELPTNTLTCEDLIEGKWIAASTVKQTKVK
jgi:hypothetical protein